MFTKKRLRHALGAVLLLSFIGAVGAYLVTGMLAAPFPSQAGDPPGNLPYENVHFPSESGSTISAWYFPVDSPKGGVVLLHGVRSNRRGMVGRVPFLHDAGYATLAIDFQAHGESPGKHITFGYLESRDARAAVEWLRQRLPNAPIGVIGQSMGGAAAVIGDKPLGADAVILESVYPTISAATSDRMRAYWGAIGAWSSWVLLIQMKPRLGFWPSDLRPIDRIDRLNAPVFIIAGTGDTYTRIDESIRLYDRAREPKRFWKVPGAGHVDIYAYTKGEYERRVLDFFRDHLN